MVGVYPYSYEPTSYVTYGARTMKSSQHVKSDIKSKPIVAAELSSTSNRPKLAVEESSPAATLAPEDRHQAIAVAAYYLAAARGFQPGSELDDWLTAEAQIYKQPH
jgi:hypothetical protein